MISAQRTEQILSLAKSNMPFLILVAMIFVGSMVSEHFLTANNIINILRQVSINGVLAAGFTLVILIDGFDMSLGAIVSACAVTAVVMLNSTHSILLAVLSSLALGALFGIVNGTLIRITKSDFSGSFLITLGVSLVGFSVAYLVSGGYIMYVDRTLHQFRQIARGTTVLGLPNLFVIMIVVMAFFQLLLKKTTFGRNLYLVGSNKVAAYYTGINSHKVIASSFLISGLCAGLAAIMMISRTGGAGPTAGNMYEIDAAIVTIIGGNAAGRASSSIMRTLIGVMIFGLISNIMNLMNFDSTIEMIVKGVILLIALYSNRSEGK
jgi:ribose transport system permease protein